MLGKDGYGEEDLKHGLIGVEATAHGGADDGLDAKGGVWCAVERESVSEVAVCCHRPQDYLCVDAFGYQWRSRSPIPSDF